MHEARIRRREVELLYRNQPLGQVVSLINAGLLAGIQFYDHQDDQAVIAVWLVCAILVAAARLADCARFRVAADDIGTHRWHQRAMFGAGASGIIWGGGALLFMPGAAIEFQLFTALVMAGMVAGAVPVLSADRNAFRAYTIPIALGVFVSLLSSDPLHIAASAMTLIFLLASLRSANYFYDALHDSLRLEQEKDLLLTDLQTAKLAAEQSDRAKTEFLANVSHELRTPLNAILGMTELLAMDNSNAAQMELLEPLRASGQELLGLINNLIELSSIEAGNLRLLPTPFIVSDMLVACVTAHGRAAAARQLKLDSAHDDQLPSVVVGDVTRLRQVLDHLLDNAIKFTESGGVSLRTELVLDGAQVLVRFEVRDTGPGIPTEKLKTITEIFSPVDGSSTRRHNGTGIGLPIARKLIELMGGSLHIETRLGVGSTFSFVLPFGRVKDQG